MVRSDFRLPESLKRAAEDEAAAEGLDYSEYVRRALAFHIAWTSAVRAVQGGAKPDDLLDIQKMIECLRIVSPEEDD